MCIRDSSFSVLENKQVRRSFFSVLFMPYNKSFIDRTSSVKMAGYWPRSLFAFLWTSTSSRSIKTQKENLVNIQPSWPSAWSIIYTYSTTSHSCKDQLILSHCWSYSGERHWDFCFAFLAIFKIGFTVFVPKISVFRFKWLLRFTVPVLFRSRFSVFGLSKTGFWDMLFDAVCCFSGFSSKNMHLNDFNHVHIL